MKKTSFAVLFFYIFSLSFSSYAKANPLLGLSVLSPPVLGATVAVVGGCMIAQAIDGGFSFDAGQMHRDVYAFREYLQDGATVAIGKSASVGLDLSEAIQSGVLQTYASLHNWLIGKFPGLDPQNLPIGEVVPIPVSENESRIGLVTFVEISPGGGPSLSIVYNRIYDKGIINGIHSWRQSVWYPTGELRSDGVPLGAWVTTHWQEYVDDPYTEDEQTIAPGIPPTISPEIEQQLAQDLAQVAGADTQVAADLDDLMKDHPGLWGFPSTAPVTPSDVAGWAQGQGSTAQDTYIQSLQDLVSANPNNAELQAQLAKAQADQAASQAQQVQEQAQQEQEKAEDTFDPIHASPFDSPYSPGPFDIPARFSSFMNNIKSSALFSFSSSFFNSLPGGGSPIYTVEAGSYGTHTIDLSETMATGLAVLKTVLLLLFGFLSIRVVILKR